MEVRWFLVNCHNLKEARTIGEAALKTRLTACYDVFPRLLTRYFWPPRKERLEGGRGCLLVVETLPTNLRALSRLVRRYHSDQLPFIGSITVDHVSSTYLHWLKGELKLQRRVNTFIKHK